MPARAVDALLFDLGNVLVEIDFERVFAAWGAAGGLRIEEVRERFRFDAVHRAFEVGAVGEAEFFDHVRGLLRVAISDESLAAGWNEVFVGEVPGMAELVESLAPHVPMYVLSNTNAVHHRRWRVRYASLLRPFASVFVSCELGARKPDRGAFAAVLERVGADPRRVAFFDDLPENAAAARAVGMPSFVVSSAATASAALVAALGFPEGPARPS